MSLPTMKALAVLYLTIFVCHSKHQNALIKYSDSEYPIVAIVSDYSPNTLDTSKPSFGTFLNHPSDPEGCSKWTDIDKTKTKSQRLNIGIVERGTCTFLQKTKYAQLAGLDAVFIVSDNEQVSPMGHEATELDSIYSELGTQDLILSAMVPHSFTKLLTLSEKTEKMQNWELTAYDTTKIWDSAMVIMIGLSTVLVAMGAYYSSDNERATLFCKNRSGNDRMGLRRQNPIQEIDANLAWSFVIVASVGLLTLYFFVSQIFIIVVIVFCIGATNGLTTIFAHLIDIVLPNLQNNKYVWFQELEFTLSDVCGFIPSVLLTAFWFWQRTNNRFAWILQNIMCMALLMVMQRNVRLPNLKIGAILLCTAFFYDIFWVFLSPFMFESSVMESVATYHHKNDTNDTLPVVLKFPKIDDIFHGFMILGLGDIALPGLFVSFCLRFDYSQMKIMNAFGMKNLKNGYFMIAVIGYGIGMFLCDLNLIFMQKGQPALLFLVPTTIGVVSLVAYKRGHFKLLWNGCVGTCAHNKLKKAKTSEEFLLKD